MSELKRAQHGNEDPGFPFWQDRLPLQLGVGIEVIRSARRQLVEGVDWVKKGQRVLFSAAGVERLQERLRVKAPVALLPERAASLERRLRVVQVPVNRFVIVAVEADGMGMPIEGGKRCVVKVKSNVNFVPGMLIQARLVEVGHGGLFELVGNCPRVKGKL
jgi:hypothetical protein